jgi:hypothetical protein
MVFGFACGKDDQNFFDATLMVIGAGFVIDLCQAVVLDALFFLCFGCAAGLFV